MINFLSRKSQLRNFALTLLASLFFASAIFTSANSQALTEQPTLLTPKKNLKSLTESEFSKDKSPSLTSPKKLKTPPSARVRTPIKINVEKLAKIDSDSVGTLTEEHGGFGFNMWEGTNRSLVERLLPKLPVNSSSRTMRALMRRLLLSSAKSPKEVNVTGKGSSSDHSNFQSSDSKGEGKLLVMRIERLSAMGDIDGVYDLVKVAPNRSIDPILLKNEVDILFLSNDNSRACDLVLRQIGKIEVPYWQKASIYCQALAGNHDEANLGANLLREIGEKDEVFYGLINSLTGVEKYKITSLPNPTPLHFSMIRAAKIRLPKDVTSSGNPAVLKTIATSPNAEPELRVETAERAESIGVLDTEVLRQIYAGVTFTQESLDNALSQAITERTALSRALLYRKAMIENIPSAKVEILSQVFKLAREVGLFQLTSRVYYKILKNLPATQDLIWFAPEAMRALLAAGDSAAAQIWLNVIKTSGLADERIIGLRDQLVPLARLNGQIPDEEWDSIKIDNWWNALANKNENPIDTRLIHARATLLYNLLEALGDNVPGHRWEALLDGPPRYTTIIPQSALWQKLSQAVDGAKRAEVVLFSLLMLGEFGPTQINPIVLRQVVMSLNLVGLSVEARSLALESAVVAGL